MKKRIAVIMLSVAVLIICMAAAMTGCKDKGNEYADLVALRINNHMAEWVDSNYNFDYKGVGELNVTVPYTNYLEINDLIVSPQAYAVVYDDEACSETIESQSRIYVDGSRVVYIKVTNGKKSRLYKINVNVKQSNLPDNVDLSAKNYDNRGGHIYIPDGAKEVKIDGDVYCVVNRMHEMDANEVGKYKNFIACGNYGFSSFSTGMDFTKSAFHGIFDGNGYLIYLGKDKYADAMNDYNRAFFNRIGERGIVRNFVLTTYGDQYSVEAEIISKETAFICYENYGVIDNVTTLLDVCDLNTELRGKYEDDFDKKYVHKFAFFANINCGTISNCLNKGNVRGLESDSKIRQFSVFSNEMYADGNIRPGSAAKLINCVNIGNIDCNSSAKGKKVSGGACIVASIADKNVEVRGVYNLGAINSEKGKRNFGGAVSVNSRARVRNIDCSKIKDYTK